MTTRLQPEEIKIARRLWLALKYGASDAHSQLHDAPENIRNIILEALADAMAKGKTHDSPFGQ